MSFCYKLLAIALCAHFSMASGVCRSQADPMMRGDTPNTNQGWQTKSLVTTGEMGDNGFNFNPTNFNYNPVGIFDGIGVVSKGRSILQTLVNHELTAGFGLPYSLKNNTVLTGARIDSWKLNTKNWCVLNGAVAYDTIFDREGIKLTDPQQLNKGREESRDFAVSIGRGFLYNGGFTFFCSGGTLTPCQAGVEDTLYFAGEEFWQGQGTVTDPKTRTTYVVPMLGQISFENAVPVENFNSNKVAILIGQDDGFPAPLWLFVGEKGARPPHHAAYDPPNFLVKNGLGFGRLYAWVADNPNFTNESNFGGTGNSASGKFVFVKQYDPSQEGQPGYDNLGFLKGTSYPDSFVPQFGPLTSLAISEGAFLFVRPEDLSPNPRNRKRAVFATTGGTGTPNVLGRLYIIELARTVGRVFKKSINEIDEFAATLRILYDSQDSGGGQFPSPVEGIRSPDNVDWACSGWVYVQEDLNSSSFCVTGVQPSMWQVNPVTGKATRILEIDRSAVPQGQIDVAPPSVCNAWESSGVLDITEKVKNPGNNFYLLFDVQAHSIIASDPSGLFDVDNLVEGSQLLVAIGPKKNLKNTSLFKVRPTPFTAKKEEAIKYTQEEWVRHILSREVYRDGVREDLEKTVKRCLKVLNKKKEK